MKTTKIFSIIMAALFVSTAIQAQSRGKSILDYKSDTIPVTILKSGHIVIPVSFTNSVKGNFIFDTGGGIELVSSALFKKIEANALRTGIFTCFKSNGERVDINTYIIPGMQIGNLRKEKVVIGVYPPLDEMGIDGLISSKFIEHIPVTIDFKNQLFTIENKASISQIARNALSIPIFIQKHGRMGLDIFVDVFITDTISILTEFDTGHGFYSAWIHPYYKNLITDNQQAIALMGNKLCLREKRNNANPSISGIEYKNDLIYNGLIGAQVFNNGRLTIDILNERMLFRE
jgi:hypothetical protein